MKKRRQQNVGLFLERSLIVQLIDMFLRQRKGNDLRRNICQKRLSERLDINKGCGGFIYIPERNKL